VKWIASTFHILDSFHSGGFEFLSHDTSCWVSRWLLRTAAKVLNPSSWSAIGVSARLRTPSCTSAPCKTFPAGKRRAASINSRPRGTYKRSLLIQAFVAKQSTTAPTGRNFFRILSCAPILTAASDAVIAARNLENNLPSA
jgi:hypothetical protein